MDAGKYQGEKRGNDGRDDADDWSDDQGERAVDDDWGHKRKVSAPTLELAEVWDDDVNDNYR